MAVVGLEIDTLVATGRPPPGKRTRRLNKWWVRCTQPRKHRNVDCCFEG